VNAPTAVTFTSQITDRQLKKRSVVLVRLDASGKPSEIFGRLCDDGRDGDLNANDSIYSLRLTLNEPAIGSVIFKVAARFKPGRWNEPESDDDDWDEELSLFNRTQRDQPARRQLLVRLLNRLGRYRLSAPIHVTVDPFSLPPDPGEAGKQTLEGIDSDGDGVRDDVERWIALSYPNSPTGQAALTHVTVALAAALVAQNQVAVKNAALAELAAARCLVYVETTRGVNISSEDLTAVFLNTNNRKDVYKTYAMAVTPDVFDTPPPSSFRTYCTFDPDMTAF
jgi:hypothetical protein